jgi:fibronectin type 3 domain-containing protein
MTSATTYYFKVAAIIGGVPSSLSNAVSALTVGGPAVPSVFPGNNQVRISWMGVAGATSYNLLRSTDLVNFSSVQSGVSGGTYTDTTAVNGTLYFYIIQAVFSSGSINSLPSSGVTPGVVPRAPQALSLVSNSTGTDVIVSWGAVSGLSVAYNVYLATNAGGPWTLQMSTTASSVVTVSGLTANTSYFLKVRAVFGDVESSDSSVLNFITAATPGAPTLTVDSSSQIVVTWGAVAGAANYDLYRSTDNFIYSLYASNIAATTYTDSGVVSGQGYFYKYLPKAAGSVPMGISAIAGPIVPGNPLLAPTNLATHVTSLTNVDLSWASVPNTVSYNIYRGTASGGPYTLLNSISAAGGAIYSDNSAVATNTYFYVIRAVNSSGVESSNSNEAGALMATGPATLTALNVANKVSLSWSAVGGATGYVIRRAPQSGGPYGILTTVGAVTSYQDSNIKNGIQYFYVVDAIIGGALSMDSVEASVVASKTMNLLVPIELTDQALASDTFPIAFDRTRTTLDPTAYDGTVTYEFEVVVSNSDSAIQTIEIVDNSGASKGTLAVPANTTSATRIRSTFIPNASMDDYRLYLPATPAPGQLQILSARMLVTQTGASKTKIYFPLMASTLPASSADVASPTESVVSAGYVTLTTGSTFKRDLSKYSSLDASNPWELEAVVSASSGTGLIALYNTNTSSIVAGSESEFSDSAIDLVNASFAEGAQEFASPTNDSNSYKIAMKCEYGCGTAQMNVYKAGLWMTLTDLESVEIPYRLLPAANITGGIQVFVDERSKIDLSAFSNPVVNFQMTASVPTAGAAVVSLMSAGTSDSGTGGLSSVAGATFNPAGNFFFQYGTSSPITLTDGNRYLLQVDTQGENVIVQDAQLLIKASP